MVGIELPWLDGKSVRDLTDEATFFESIQEGWVYPGTEPVEAEESVEELVEGEPAEE